ncbi:MAG: thrombospondin type 3 repeat-containing protein, partial [Planctomycetota bacterium]
MGNRKFDVIVIDGLDRRQLVPVACERLAEGGIVICDNAEGYGFHEALKVFASNATTADGNFTNWTTNGAVTVPPNAGWFISPPILPDNSAESLSGVAGTRVNLSGGTATATHGVWCAHLVLANTANAYTVNFGGQVSIRAGNSSNTFQGSSSGAFAIDGDGDDDGTPDALDSCPDVAGPCSGCPTNVCGTCGTPPDADGDGRIDCQDNCPTVANASQA